MSKTSRTGSRLCAEHRVGAVEGEGDITRSSRPVGIQQHGPITKITVHRHRQRHQRQDAAQYRPPAQLGCTSYRYVESRSPLNPDTLPSIQNTLLPPIDNISKDRNYPQPPSSPHVPSSKPKRRHHPSTSPDPIRPSIPPSTP